MNSYQTRGQTLDPGAAALALRDLRERRGNHRFIARVITKSRRQGLVVPTSRTPATAAPVPTSSYFAVVRRGNAEVFQKLIEHFRGDPDVTVIWDRRRGERRSSSQSAGDERRRTDRRCVVPALWENADYVLVPLARRFARSAGRAPVRRRGTPPGS